MIEEQSAQASQEVEEIKEYIVQGQQARDVLDNKLFMSWFKTSQETLFDILDTLPLSDAGSRQRAIDIIYLFRKFEKTFKEFADTGEIAEKRWREIIEDEEGRKKGLLGRIFDAV